MNLSELNYPPVDLDNADAEDEQHEQFVLKGYETGRKDISVAYAGFSAWLVVAGLSLWASAAWDLGDWPFWNAVLMGLVPLGFALGAKDQPRTLLIDEFIRYSYRKYNVHEIQQVVFSLQTLKNGKQVHHMDFYFPRRVKLKFYIPASAETDTQNIALIKQMQDFFQKKSVTINVLNYNRSSKIDLAPLKEIRALKE